MINSKNGCGEKGGKMLLVHEDMLHCNACSVSDWTPKAYIGKWPWPRARNCCIATVNLRALFAPWLIMLETFPRRVHPIYPNQLGPYLGAERHQGREAASVVSPNVRPEYNEHYNNIFCRGTR